MNDEFLQQNVLTLECEQNHQQKLIETERRVAEGKELYMDWKQAKKDLRKEFE
jgi:hypothetical protein